MAHNTPFKTEPIRVALRLGWNSSGEVWLLLRLESRFLRAEGQARSQDRQKKSSMLRHHALSLQSIAASHSAAQRGVFLPLPDLNHWALTCKLPIEPTGDCQKCHQALLVLLENLNTMVRIRAQGFLYQCCYEHVYLGSVNLTDVHLCLWLLPTLPSSPLAINIPQRSLVKIDQQDTPKKILQDRHITNF
jgi:hypothetical protein